MTPAQVWIPCTDCNGTGEVSRAVRWAGEAFGEWVSHLCEACGGDGGEEADPACFHCEGPLGDDGFCAACNESGLTETLPDPLRHLEPVKMRRVA